MQNAESLAAEFIVAYYKSVVYSNDVKKFYDEENAVIYRDGGDSNTGIAFEQASSCLIPVISATSQVKITSYNVLTIPSGVMIVANGTIDSKCFTQCFTLNSVCDRVLIESDSLTFALNPQTSTDALICIPPPPKK